MQRFSQNEIESMRNNLILQSSKTPEEDGNLYDLFRTVFPNTAVTPENSYNDKSVGFNGIPISGTVMSVFASSDSEGRALSYKGYYISLNFNVYKYGVLLGTDEIHGDFVFDEPDVYPYSNVSLSDILGVNSDGTNYLFQFLQKYYGDYDTIEMSVSAYAVDTEGVHHNGIVCANIIMSPLPRFG